MTQEIHSCFISYRHPASAGGREEKLIRQVIKAIKDHVELYTHEYTVYYDKDRLIPGYQYNEQLASAICRSACMIVVYWPSYLESSYCRKEIYTMLNIEKVRKKKLKEELHGYRLFIPIILHGKFDDLSNEVGGDCQYLDYSQQALNPNMYLGDDPNTSKKLYRIAEYIKNLCDKMKKNEEMLFQICDKYCFSSEIENASKEKLVANFQPPFPGR